MCPGRTTQGNGCAAAAHACRSATGASGIAVVSAPPTPFFKPAGLAHHSVSEMIFGGITAAAAGLIGNSVRLTVWTMGNPSGHVGVLGILFSRSLVAADARRYRARSSTQASVAIAIRLRCRYRAAFAPTLILTQTGLLGSVRSLAPFLRFSPAPTHPHSPADGRSRAATRQDAVDFATRDLCFLSSASRTHPPSLPSFAADSVHDRHQKHRRR